MSQKDADYIKKYPNVVLLKIYKRTETPPRANRNILNEVSA